MANLPLCPAEVRSSEERSDKVPSNVRVTFVLGLPSRLRAASVKTPERGATFGNFFMFESFYGSFYQHPVLLLLAPVVFLAFIPRKAGSFSLYLWMFTMLAIADPLMTGPLTKWWPLSEGVAEAVMIFFVILGDLRFFYLLEHFCLPHEDVARLGQHRRTLGAVSWSFLVPVTQLILIRSFPEFFSEARYTFLVYELLFFFVAAYFREVWIPSRNAAPELERWLRAVCSYVMLYYALWASADVLILFGDGLVSGLSDAGFALRVVPNVLYYGLFLPFVFRSAPASWRNAVPKSAKTDLGIDKGHGGSIG
jgi:hypothetical protein